MRPFFPACAIACTLLAATAAGAEGFTTQDLGNIADDPACMAKAERVFEAYAREVSVGDAVYGSWNAALYDVINADYEVLIVCSYGPGNQSRVTAVVYSDEGASDDTRVEISRRVKSIWQSMD